MFSYPVQEKQLFRPLDSGHDLVLCFYRGLHHGLYHTACLFPSLYRLCLPFPGFWLGPGLSRAACCNHRYFADLLNLSVGSSGYLSFWAFLEISFHKKPAFLDMDYAFASDQVFYCVF